jgi:hypothetical protein
LHEQTIIRRLALAGGRKASAFVRHRRVLVRGHPS